MTKDVITRIMFSASQPQPFWLLILSLSITGSIVAAVASAVNDYFRRRYELQKWRAEFYLRPKLEALRNLHTAMVRCHYELNARAKAQMPKDLEQYRDQVKRPENDFFGSLTTAEIYLDAETIKVMHAVLGAVRQISLSIWFRLPGIFEQYGQYQDSAFREPDWKLFHESYGVAHARLKHFLHPDELVKWAEGNKTG